MSPLLMLLTFVAGTLAVVAVYSVITEVFLKDSSKVNRRLEEELSRRQKAQQQKAKIFRDLGVPSSGDLDSDEEDETGLRRRFEAMVEQSGLDLSPQKLLTFMVVGALALAAVGLLLPVKVVAVPLGAALGAGIPFLYVYWKRKVRMEKLMGQLPDAFDLMARVIRAGQTMTQAMQAVADEFDQPISGEFGYCYEQQNLGLSPEISMRDLGKRTGVLEIKIFVLAMLVQQQAGGNLAELLDKLSTVIRERFRIRGRIRALTAEGRLQAIILLILPLVLLGAILIVNREYGRVLLEHPWLLVGMFFFEFVGAVWIRNIINFDF